MKAKIQHCRENGNKENVFLTCLFVFCLFIVVGCQGGEKKETASAAHQADSNLSSPGTMPIVKEPITLNIFAPSDEQGHDRGDSLQTKELEEMTGIKMVWQVAPAASIKEKLNLMFASGDTTDLVTTGVGLDSRLDMSTEALYGSQGLILPLNQYFDTVSIGYKAAFEELSGMREYITTPDGNIYSMPNVDGSLHVQYNCKLWINTYWLKNLGLSMPTTTEEFYQVMKAFKEKDANGNGNPNDEIPLSTCKSGTGVQIDGFLMNPFQLTPEAEKLYLENKKVVFSPVTDNYREGLRYLHRLYAEGLINPESFTQDRQNQVNKNENGPHTVIGAFLAQRPGYAADLTTLPNSKKWEQYESLPPLKGPSGKATAAWNPYIIYQSGQTFIPSKSKYPEAAFRLVDYIATKEGSLRASFGVKGVHWEDALPGELGLDGEQAEIRKIPGSGNVAGDTNYAWGQLMGLIRSPRFTEFLVTDPNPYAPDVIPLDGRQVTMYRGSLEHEKVRQPLESVLPSLYQTAEEVEEMTLVKRTVVDYTNESIIRFVTGDLNIDRDWDGYINQLKNIGLDRYLELLQIAYDRSAFSKM
jgi:putative aldouronate transport system substrate-binding protein